MPNQIGEALSLRGHYNPKYNFTFNLSGTTSKADEGKALAIDPSAPNTLKLAGDGDRVIASALVIENRVTEGIVVVDANLSGFWKFDYTGADPAIGASVVGSATAGKVKAAVWAAGNPTVMEVDSTAKTVIVAVGVGAL